VPVFGFTPGFSGGYIGGVYGKVGGVGSGGSGGVIAECIGVIGVALWRQPVVASVTASANASE
jgi:hypothetical protein